MMKTPLAIITLLSFLITGIIGPMPVYATDEFHLPAPCTMVHLSPEFNPPILKGIKVHPEEPFRFDFILDKGDSPSLVQRGGQGELKQEATKLIKYFLASLTIPEDDLWVNLSPYEKKRIIPQSFGLTEMGRDLLAEDYMLKQLTASLVYPEDETGKKFWKRIYEEAAKKFGTTNIPVNTFNKVWIIPEKAVVYENAQAGTAYVVESKLKVMLEQDYLSIKKHTVETPFMASHTSSFMASHTSPFMASLNRDAINRVSTNNINALGSQITREIVIPELDREVNEGKNFAQLRQVYNSLILATWYKKKIKDSILEQIYADKNKVEGVGYAQSIIPPTPTRGHVQIRTTKNVSPSSLPSNEALNVKVPQGNPQNDVELIYQRYLKAFKKGVFNYIKEDTDTLTQETIPRKYFSGGLDMAMTKSHYGLDKAALSIVQDSAMVPPNSMSDNIDIIQENTLPSDENSQTINASPSADMQAAHVGPVKLDMNSGQEGTMIRGQLELFQPIIAELDAINARNKEYLTPQGMMDERDLASHQLDLLPQYQKDQLRLEEIKTEIHVHAREAMDNIYIQVKNVLSKNYMYYSLIQKIIFLRHLEFLLSNHLNFGNDFLAPEYESNINSLNGGSMLYDGGIEAVNEIKLIRKIDQSEEYKDLLGKDFIQTLNWWFFGKIISNVIYFRGIDIGYRSTEAKLWEFVFELIKENPDMIEVLALSLPYLIKQPWNFPNTFSEQVMPLLIDKLEKAGQYKDLITQIKKPWVGQDGKVKNWGDPDVTRKDFLLGDNFSLINSMIDGEIQQNAGSINERIVEALIDRSEGFLRPVNSAGMLKKHRLLRVKNLPIYQINDFMLADYIRLGWDQNELENSFKILGELSVNSGTDFIWRSFYENENSNMTGSNLILDAFKKAKGNTKIFLSELKRIAGIYVNPQSVFTQKLYLLLVAEIEHYPEIVLLPAFVPYAAKINNVLSRLGRSHDLLEGFITNRQFTSVLLQMAKNDNLGSLVWIGQRIGNDSVPDFLKKAEDFPLVIDHWDEIANLKLDGQVTVNELMANAVAHIYKLDITIARYFVEHPYLVQRLDDKEYRDVIINGIANIGGDTRLFFGILQALGNPTTLDVMDLALKKFMALRGGYQVEQNRYFDPADPISMALEYDRFYREYVIQGEKASDENVYTFEFFQGLMVNYGKPGQNKMTPEIQASLAYTSFEVKKFFDFVMSLKIQADKAGRKVLVVPNFTYGWFLSIPVRDAFERLGIRVADVRCGSSEAHSNEYLVTAANKDQFFDKDTTDFIMREKPVMVFMDGSNSFIRAPKGGGRYPDAGKAWVNNIALINMALKDNEDATGTDPRVNETVTDPKDMRDTQHFQELVATQPGQKMLSWYRSARERLGLMPLEENPYHVEYYNPMGETISVTAGGRQQNRYVRATPRSLLPEQVSSFDFNKESVAVMATVNVIDAHMPDYLKAYAQQLNNGQAIEHSSASLDDNIDKLFVVDKKGVHRSTVMTDEFNRQFQFVAALVDHKEGRENPIKVPVVEAGNLSSLPFAVDKQFGAVVLDIDGTLKLPGAKISEDLLTTIVQLLQAGFKVMAISGRSKSIKDVLLDRLKRRIKDDRLLNNLYIGEQNGAYGYQVSEGEIKILRKIRRLDRKKIKEQLSEERWKEYGFELQQRDAKREAIIAIEGVPKEKRAEVVLKIKQEIGDWGLKDRFDVFDTGSNINIMQLGVNKGAAVRIFAEDIGLDQKDILKVGNSYGPHGNDLPMLILPSGVGVDSPEATLWLLREILKRGLLQSMVERSKASQGPIGIKDTGIYLRHRYPGIKVIVIGATSPTEGYQNSDGEELGRHLGNWFKAEPDRGNHLFTGGVDGVGVDVYKGLAGADSNADDIFSVLLPQFVSPAPGYDENSPRGDVARDMIGQNMEQRRLGIGFVADILVVMNGEAGTMHEAITGLKNGRKLIALAYGGAGQELYDAKITGIIPDSLRREGLTEEHLKLITPSTMKEFENTLQAVSKDLAMNSLGPYVPSDEGKRKLTTYDVQEIIQKLLAGFESLPREGEDDRNIKSKIAYLRILQELFTASPADQYDQESFYRTPNGIMLLGLLLHSFTPQLQEYARDKLKEKLEASWIHIKKPGGDVWDMPSFRSEAKRTIAQLLKTAAGDPELIAWATDIIKNLRSYGLDETAMPKPAAPQIQPALPTAQPTGMLGNLRKRITGLFSAPDAGTAIQPYSPVTAIIPADIVLNSIQRLSDEKTSYSVREKESEFLDTVVYYLYSFVEGAAANPDPHIQALAADGLNQILEIAKKHPVENIAWWLYNSGEPLFLNKSLRSILIEIIKNAANDKISETRIRVWCLQTILRQYKNEGDKNGFDTLAKQIKRGDLGEFSKEDKELMARSKKDPDLEMLQNGPENGKRALLKELLEKVDPELTRVVHSFPMAQFVRENPRFDNDVIDLLGEVVAQQQREHRVSGVSIYAQRQKIYADLLRIIWQRENERAQIEGPSGQKALINGPLRIEDKSSSQPGEDQAMNGPLNGAQWEHLVTLDELTKGYTIEGFGAWCDSVRKKMNERIPSWSAQDMINEIVLLTKDIMIKEKEKDFPGPSFIRDVSSVWKAGKIALYLMLPRLAELNALDDLLAALGKLEGNSDFISLVKKEVMILKFENLALTPRIKTLLGTHYNFFALSLPRTEDGLNKLAEELDLIKSHSGIEIENILVRMEQLGWGLDDIPFVIKISTLAGPFTLTILSKVGKLFDKKQLESLIEEPRSQFFNSIPASDTDSNTVVKLGIVALIAGDIDAKRLSKERLSNIAGNQELGVARFYAYAFSYAAGAVDRKVVEQQAAVFIKELYENGQYSSPIDRFMKWYYLQKILIKESGELGDQTLTSFLLAVLFAMARSNSVLENDQVLLAEAARIINQAKLESKSDAYILAHADYRITFRTFTYGIEYAIKVCAHEIGHHLLDWQGMDVLNGFAFGEYYANWQWWGLAADVLGKENIKLQESIEKTANFEESFENAIRYGGRITNTEGLGDFEHVASRARQYQLIHSVPEVGNDRKNEILQQMVSAMKELNHPVSFSVAGDIHQQLCELTAARGEIQSHELFLQLIKDAPLRGENPSGDTVVFSQAYVDRINANRGKPVKMNYAQLTEDQSMKSPSRKGGIDLTPANMNVQTKVMDSRFRGNDIAGNGNDMAKGGIKFHMDPAMLERLRNAPGFVPVIINILPMTDLRLFLGLSGTTKSRGSIID